MKILAVIVTHNRCELLSRCIDHVLAQTRKPDTLLVINNASTDGTEAMLKARGITHINQPNVGSAGGWHRGLQYGLEAGYDYIWLMDDDGYPDALALESLVRQLRPDIACVSSVVVCEDAPEQFVFPFPHLDRDGLPVLFRWPRKMALVKDLERHLTGGLYAFANLFNGALINARAVEEVGNVNEEYYLSGDEVDYYFRLKTFGAVVSDIRALHYHPDVSKRPFSEIKMYYFVKNTIILNNLYFNHALVRNIATVAILLARIALRNGLREACSYVVGSRRGYLARAILLGLKGQIGRDFVA